MRGNRQIGLKPDRLHWQLCPGSELKYNNVIQAKVLAAPTAGGRLQDHLYEGFTADPVMGRPLVNAGIPGRRV